ncbi:hypothetical protein ACFSHQ_03685 [Gemmobacter lanyuensis]
MSALLRNRGDPAGSLASGLRSPPPRFPFNWHYHPEFELTLTVGSRGMRFVGDDVGQYDDCDLVLIAPNVPHAFQSQELLRGASEHRAVVSWFAQGWIEG